LKTWSKCSYTQDIGHPYDWFVGTISRRPTGLKRDRCAREFRGRTGKLRGSRERAKTEIYSPYQTPSLGSGWTGNEKESSQSPGLHDQLEKEKGTHLIKKLKESLRIANVVFRMGITGDFRKNPVIHNLGATACASGVRTYQTSPGEAFFPLQATRPSLGIITHS